MAATAAQIAELRRMVNVAADDATYTDEVLGGYIERYPIVDSAGYDSDEDDWTETYSLYAAAVDVLSERIAAQAEDFDFQADGAAFSRSQQARLLLQLREQYRGMADQQMTALPV